GVVLGFGSRPALGCNRRCGCGFGGRFGCCEACSHPRLGCFELGLDPCVFDGLGGGVQVRLESLGPFFGVQAGGEDVRGVVLEVQVEVDIGAVVGAAAAHTPTGLPGLDGAGLGLGVVVVFVV